jgi:hypothetical protein
VSKPEVEAEPVPKAEAEPEPETQATLEPDVQAEKLSNVAPELVNRVHHLYEELGRKDLRAAEAREKAKREHPEDDPAQ